MYKTLTLRLNEDQARLLESVIYEYQENTASKAIHRALQDVIPQRANHDVLQDEVKRLREQVSVLEQRISAARHAAALLLEKVSQEDILSDGSIV